MLYMVVKCILGAMAHVLFRVTIRGASNVPAEGPVVLCANHIAWWDPVLVAFALKRPVHFMAKKELFRYPVLSYLFRRIHAFPVNRGKPDLGAVKAALTVLKEGHVLGIFPEGTRQKDKECLGEMHAGAALFALKSGAPVVPAAIRGTYKFGKPVVLVFGESLTLEAGTGRTSADMGEGARAIEVAISRLWESIREESRVTAREAESC
jgi:1-acyl-sn-glycerol-3-phosphate acyltransferase